MKNRYMYYKYLIYGHFPKINILYKGSSRTVGFQVKINLSISFMSAATLLGPFLSGFVSSFNLGGS